MRTNKGQYTERSDRALLSITDPPYSTERSQDKTRVWQGKRANVICELQFVSVIALMCDCSHAFFLPL